MHDDSTISSRERTLSTANNEGKLALLTMNEENSSIVASETTERSNPAASSSADAAVTAQEASESAKEASNTAEPPSVNGEGTEEGGEASPGDAAGGGETGGAGREPSKEERSAGASQGDKSVVIKP
ncbi:hypothetical protein ACLOJK_021639 [Asimina triloba]